MLCCAVLRCVALAFDVEILRCITSMYAYVCVLDCCTIDSNFECCSMHSDVDVDSMFKSLVIG